MISAILDAFAATTDQHASIMEITRRFVDRAGDTLGRQVSNKWVGSFVRRRLRLPTIKTGGVYVVQRTERGRLDVLAQRFGVHARSTQSPGL